MKAKLFPTEAALCAAFIAAVDKRTWISYAETQNWDILLVRKSDGFQIGIQAKLRLSVDVINQALEDGYSYSTNGPQPDCRSVLVPKNSANGYGKICDYVGLTVIRMGARDFYPYLPKRDDWHEQWYDMAPMKRHKLPEYVPDVAAGASSPLQLTEWKIKALKISIILDHRGTVTRADFSAIKIDHRRWVAMRWIKVRHDGKFVRDAAPDFKTQHPVVYEKIKADAHRWMPKPQERLL